MTENKEIIKVEDLSVTIKTGAKEIPVLRDVRSRSAKESGGRLQGSPGQAKA